MVGIASRARRVRGRASAERERRCVATNVCAYATFSRDPTRHAHSGANARRASRVRLAFNDAVLATPRAHAAGRSARGQRHADRYRTAVQSTDRSGSVSSACHVAASVSPVAASPRAVWKACSAAFVAAVNFAVERDRRVGGGEVLLQPDHLVAASSPGRSAGQPGSDGTTGAGAGSVSTAHAASLVACQLHHDSPPAP